MNKKRVHFIGIGGAGASAAAWIAYKRGYDVSGCDANLKSRYLQSSDLPSDRLYQGHNVDHVAGADIVAASPATIERSSEIPEVQAAKSQGKLMTWQQFVGRELMASSRRVCVSGTHGKTTTTSMLGNMLVEAKLDPTVIVGGVVRDWSRNALVGKSKIFLCEADEYNYNFMSYQPEVNVLNNIEFEHPEFFVDEASYLQAFQDYIESMPARGTLVANGDDRGVRQIVDLTRTHLDRNRIETIWTIRDDYNAATWNFAGKTVRWRAINLGNSGMSVSLTGHIECAGFELNMIGLHNAQNAVMAMCAAVSLGADPVIAARSMSTFSGVERRLQEVFAQGTLRIFDDYGHHPTEVASTLDSLRGAFADYQIIAVIEPHMVSRMNRFGEKYVEATRSADKIIFTKTFPGRETGKKLPNILNVVKMIGDDKASYFNEFDTTASNIARLDLNETVIVIFGAGNSPQLTQKIIQSQHSKV